MEKKPITATISEAKYQKLAQEYSKLRAQATVLKKALLDEQEEKTNLKEHLRQQQTTQRRSEQEVDSLGFRNKQLEHRVAVLQEELAEREGRKKDHKRGSKTDNASAPGNAATVLAHAGNGSELAQDAIIFEELQKKIMENAQLTSLVDDKVRELQLHAERIANLEQSVQKQAAEQNELEKRWRRELDTLQNRNSELETKLVEAASIFGSEDALSVSGSDNTPLHQNNMNAHIVNAATTGVPPLNTSETRSNEDRIAQLEREVAHWRAQCEVARLQNEPLTSKNSREDDAACGCSTTAAGLMVKPSFIESKSVHSRDSNSALTTIPPTREQELFNHFSKKYEELLKKTCESESRVRSYETETENLQNCLEDATEQQKVINKKLREVEEDLATTRINYEEQISVLTEQVINLSEQLAACK